jgi:hypothetical protein
VMGRGEGQQHGLCEPARQQEVSEPISYRSSGGFGLQTQRSDPPRTRQGHHCPGWSFFGRVVITSLIWFLLRSARRQPAGSSPGRMYVVHLLLA